MHTIMLGMEWIGAAAFAVSGALVAIRRKMDLLGVLILGIITAVGGGMLRDILLGDVPPAVFRDPTQASIALVVALSVFVFLYAGHSLKGSLVYEQMLFWCDTLGLAAFTVAGMNKAFVMGQGMGIAVVMGVLTGVGGGIFRDVLAGERPAIFVRHVYASASIVGALVGAALWCTAGQELAAVVSAAVVVLIRMLAARYRWNLPRVKLHSDGK